MRAVRLLWPGLALGFTFVDDFVAGPILAAAAAVVGGCAGLLLGVVTFTLVVGLLVLSALMASRTVEPKIQARIDSAVTAASDRRWVGRFVHRVGDGHLWSTAVVAAVVSPVLAVLLARMIHPRQTLVRTTLVAIAAYGLAFSVFYAGLGAGLTSV